MFLSLLCITIAGFVWGSSKTKYCNEIDRVIARAKVRVLKCITVAFECNARTSSMTKRRLYGE